MSVKNQHYVPQFYLRAFSTAHKKSKREIWQFNKTSESKTLSLVKKTASEDYFYELPDFLQKALIHKFREDDNFNLVENRLAKYEVVFSEYFRTFLAELNKPSKDLSTFLMNHSNRLWITFFIVIQFYRTKKWRDIKKQEYMKIDRNTVKKGNNVIEDWKTYKLMEERALNHALLDQQINLVDKIGLEKLNADVNDIGNYLWTVGENLSSIPFITSDSPLVRHSNLTINGIPTSGFLFPLSERFILIILDTPILNPDFSNIRDKKIELLEDEVRCMNTLQLNQSFSFIYSSKQNLDKFIWSEGII